MQKGQDTLILKKVLCGKEKRSKQNGCYPIASITSFFLGIKSTPYHSNGLPRWLSDRGCLPMQEMWDAVSIPGSGRFPGGGNGNPLQYSCWENPHGQRSLVGYSLWSHKKSDVTDYACTHPNNRVNSLVSQSSWLCLSLGTEKCPGFWEGQWGGVTCGAKETLEPIFYWEEFRSLEIVLGSSAFFYDYNLFWYIGFLFISNTEMSFLIVTGLRALPFSPALNCKDSLGQGQSIAKAGRDKTNCGSSADVFQCLGSTEKLSEDISRQGRPRKKFSVEFFLKKKYHLFSLSWTLLPLTLPWEREFAFAKWANLKIIWLLTLFGHRRGSQSSFCSVSDF